MVTIIGHEKQRQELVALVQTERLPSALLLSGLGGIGKSLIAAELSRHILCEKRVQAQPGGCGACRPCVLFNSGTHPDLHTMSFGGEDGATVDDIRGVLERMSLKPFMGGSKVAIFRDADNISTVGANIILKSLEEPRPDTYFILVAANPSRLPATILSRCQRFFFDRLSPLEIKEIMHARGLPEVSEAVSLLADGSAASLDSLQAHAEMWEEIRGVVEKAWAGDAGAIAKAAQEWGAEKAALRDRLTFLRTTVREKLLHNGHHPAAAAVWATALQNVLDAEYLVLERHVNPTLTILKLLQSCNQALSRTYQLAPNSVRTLGENILDDR